MPGRLVALGLLLVLPSLASGQEPVEGVLQIGGKFGGRGGGRKALGRKGGAPIADAIRRALDWLAAHQFADGHWSAARFRYRCPPDEPCKGKGSKASEVLVTGLALLAFLGDGSTPRVGPYRDSVKRGVVWLEGRQSAETGLMGEPNAPTSTFDHALATFALVEACGLSPSRRLERHAQRALDHLAEAGNDDGGWGCRPGDGKSLTATTCWAITALKSAQDFRLEVPAERVRSAARWLDALADARTGRYVPRVSPALAFESSPNCVLAAPTFARVLLGQTKKAEPILALSGDRMSRRPPEWAEGAIDFGYWLHGSYAMFQLGGRHWKQWRKGIDRALIATQQKEGHGAGSWEPAGIGGPEGGRVYVTALGALTLQVYYRYTRLMR